MAPIHGPVFCAGAKHGPVPERHTKSTMVMDSLSARKVARLQAVIGKRAHRWPWTADKQPQGPVTQGHLQAALSAQRASVTQACVRRCTRSLGWRTSA